MRGEQRPNRWSTPTVRHVILEEIKLTYVSSPEVRVYSATDRVDRVEEKATRIEQSELKGETCDAIGNDMSDIT